MSRNQVVKAGKRIAVPVFRISGAFQHSAVLSVLMLAALGLGGCAGLVSGTTSNPPSSSTLTISNVQTTSTTTSTSQILWTTNVAADSMVDYGITPTYGSSTPVNSAMVTNHQVVLSGLAPDTTYYYEVASTDSKGNHGKSGGHSFKTLGFSISGTITPVAGGSGATLTLTGAANSTTTSDSSGNYTFTGLSNGTYTISPQSRRLYVYTKQSEHDDQWRQCDRSEFHRHGGIFGPNNHYAAGEPDRDGGADGHLRSGGDGNGAAELPVE